MRNIVGIDARMIEHSGIGTYIQHLMGRGIYDYAVGDEEKIRRYDPAVKIIPFDAPVYSPREQLSFPVKEIRKAGITLMHFPHYNVPLFYGGEYVVTVHDLTHVLFPEFMGSKAKVVYAKRLMSHALKSAKHVFTVSENSKRDIMSFFGIPAEKISITYNAIDNDFRPKTEQETAYLFGRFDIPEDKKLILYVGNLKPHKNLGTLLKALKILNREDVALILVGKAFKSLELETQEADLGLAGKVIHTGVVSKQELVDLYNLADVFVFPSLYEGFGIPPLEAMACGTPVVAADNSSIPEVVGDAALLVDGKDEKQIAEAINKVLEEKKLAEKLVQAGLARCRQFSWDDTVREVSGWIRKTADH